MPAKFKLRCVCDQIFIVDERFFGKKLRCPSCKRAMAVPIPEGAKPAEAPTEAPAAEAEAQVEAPAPAEETPAEEAAEEEPEAPAEEAPAAPADDDHDDGPKVLKASAGGIEFEDPTEMTVEPTDMTFGDGSAEPGLALDADAGAAAPAAEPAGAPDEGEVAGTGHEDPTKLDKCPHCSNPLTTGSVFCVTCGTDLRSGRKLRKVTVEKEETGLSYDPPVEGQCCMCQEEAVQVVMVSRGEFLESKRVMKVVSKDVESKKPTEQELQTALTVQIGGGEERPLCEKCAKKLKIGPKKFADLIEPEEEPVEEAEAPADGEAAEEPEKKKGGLLGKLRKKK